MSGSSGIPTLIIALTWLQLKGKALCALEHGKLEKWISGEEWKVEK